MTNSIWAPLRSVLSPSSKPIRIRWTSTLRDGSKSAVGGADLRRREIHLHPSLRGDERERSRILVHETFQFVWVRLGNPARASWKSHLQNELRLRARGELGYSAEWRKENLPKHFNQYACEAFCDTAAWIYAGFEQHPECTLAARWADRRRKWFDVHLRLPLAY